MYLIYKGKEFFGVWYNSIVTALYVCNIFQQTLCEVFSIRWAPSLQPLLTVND